MNPSPDSVQAEESAPLHIGTTLVAHHAAPLERSGGFLTFSGSPGITCFRYSRPEVVSGLVWFLHDIDPIQAQYECKHLVSMVMQSFPSLNYEQSRSPEKRTRQNLKHIGCAKAHRMCQALKHHS